MFVVLPLFAFSVSHLIYLLISLLIQFYYKWFPFRK